jgi:hypothetical protein
MQSIETFCSVNNRCAALRKRFFPMRHWIIVLLGLISEAGVGFGQVKDSVFLLSPDHPAIEYVMHPTSDPVSELNRKIQKGEVHLKFEGSQGYLRSLLNELNVPIESQMMVFSKTSVQAPRIQPRNPRALFFNDSVTIGWVPGGFVEMAVQDPKQGTVFYTLDQHGGDKPVIMRRNGCLACHVSHSTLGIPGMLVRSVYTAADGRPLRELGEYVSDHRSALAERWGGWYVTGKDISIQHMGNVLTNPDRPESTVTRNAMGFESLRTRVDTDTYLSPYSDIVALMVFEHQMHMMNLLTRIGWEVRYASYRKGMGDLTAKEKSNADLTLDVPNLSDSVKELVDYLLFIDEAPLPSRIEGTSGFAEKFAAEGPDDRRGRSLRQFDLRHRLMRYPCSYMIYSRAFDELPEEVRSAIYARMWRILSGQERNSRYARLSLSDRRAIIEILSETKKGLPRYFLRRTGNER